MRKLLFILLFSCVNIIYSQEPSILWQNTIGGSMNDRLRSIFPTNDGGCIIGGISNSNSSFDKTENTLGLEDFWLVKLDNNGNIEWDNTIGGSGKDELMSIKQTNDNGYIILGMSRSDISSDKTENSRGIDDYWIVKTDVNGVIQWDKTIGGSTYDFPYDILVLDDGSYIVGGTSASNISGDKTENSNGNNDFWVLKLNSSGSIVWQNTIGGSNTDTLNSMDLTNDGGIILAGNSDSDISGDKTENSKGGNDSWLVKLSANGVVEWDRTIGGSDTDGVFSVKQTEDNGFILGGISQSNISGDKTEDNIGSNDYWIVKTDHLGIIQWQNTIGGTGSEGNGYTLPTSDGGYIIIGWSMSDISGDKDENSVGSFDLWIVKLNNSGIIQWQETLGGDSNELAFRVDFSIAPNSNQLYLGCSSYSGISGDKTEQSYGQNDFWIMLLDDVSLGINTPENKSVKILPNPVNSTLTVSSSEQIDSLYIYSIQGRLIKMYQNINSDSKNINIAEYPSGLYLVKIKSKNKTITKKIIKI